MSPVNTQHILGEGAAIFTNMTETMVTALDQQMTLSSKAQKPSNIRKFKTIPHTVNKIEDKYPDLYLPVTENYRISNRFLEIWTVCHQIITQWYW